MKKAGPLLSHSGPAHICYTLLLGQRVTVSSVSSTNRLINVNSNDKDATSDDARSTRNSRHNVNSVSSGDEASSGAELDGASSSSIEVKALLS